MFGWRNFIIVKTGPPFFVGWLPEEQIVGEIIYRKL